MSSPEAAGSVVDAAARSLKLCSSDGGSWVNGHDWKHWPSVLSELTTWETMVEVGKGKKGHSLLSIIFKESSVLFKTEKKRFVSNKSGISAELDN